MTQIPLNLGLRDLDIEEHNGTGKSDYAYIRAKHLMIRLIDVVNGIDPSLHAYMDVFCNQEREVVFQNDQFLIQYDGLRKGDHMYDNHWRLIWRDLAIQWYKHPQRALEATREFSHAEEALLVAEFKEAMSNYIEPKTKQGSEPSVSAMQAGLEAFREKLTRNSVSGSHVRTLNGSVNGLEPRLDYSGSIGSSESITIDPMGFLDLDGNPRSDVDVSEFTKTTAPGTGAGVDFSNIRPKGERVSEEGNRYDFESARKFFEETAKNIHPSLRPGMSLKLTPQAFAEGMRTSKLMDKAIKGENIGLLELANLLGSKSIGNESPEVRALMADIDPAPPIDEETLRAYGLIKKEVGCAPPYFITAARPQARPKVTAFMVKLALYMKYVTDKEKN